MVNEGKKDFHFFNFYGSVDIGSRKGILEMKKTVDKIRSFSNLFTVCS